MPKLLNPADIIKIGIISFSFIWLSNKIMNKINPEFATNGD